MKDSPSLSALLAKSELKRTPFRRELLQVFTTAKAPLSAAQIYQLLRSNKKLKSHRFDRTTLFRNLKTLVSKNILNTTEFGTGAAFYCLNSDHDHHHHHVYCIRCETARPLAVCVVAPMIANASELGYQVLNHKFEVIGICPGCQ